MRRLLLSFAAGLLVLFALIQVLPIGDGRSNPPVAGEPDWDSPQTRELFFQACANCHSNETRWPWYGRVAPVSWFLEDHVHDGRRHFNVSEWGVQENDDADEAADMVRKGKMPLRSYKLLHPEARLPEADREALIRGLEATFGTDEEHGTEGNDGAMGAEGP